MSTSNELSEESSDSETDYIDHLQDDYPIVDEHKEHCEYLRLDDYNTSNEDTEREKSTSEITILYAFILLSFQSIFQISDFAMSVLLTFMVTFLQITLKHYHAEHILPLCDELPHYTASARNILGHRKQQFNKYACCPSCFSLYSWDSTKANEITNFTCNYIKFPNHPQTQHRKACGTQLVKAIKTTGQSIYYPYLFYCYKPVLESLQDLLMRKDFISNCEAWRTRSVKYGVYQDVYDGQVWHDFLSPSGKPFLALPFNFAFSINTDWFQPFTHTQHSEGAIYITVLNLQRKLRYLWENVILLGVIPGPKEPKHTNSILQPFVNEMLRLWKGVTMQTYDGINVLVRAAVICCACDIPAARKVCGFVGHAGIKGCSRWLLSFTTDSFGEKADYTNVNREEWPIRTKSAHLDASNLHKHAKTKTEQKQIERENGPYFDAPRMCIVDPMHNLWLGTSKNLMELWKSSQLLIDKDFCIIQQRVNGFITPNDIGRIPSKIASNCAGFTAEQWKNWTIYFSLYALQGILPRPHYQCWLLFVKACYILCRQRISKVQLDEADKFLMMFYAEVVQLYGNSGCNMNLHLHGHMCDYIKDYGTVYSFWLFPLERLNGVLGSFPTNARNIRANHAALLRFHYICTKQMAWKI